VRLAKFAGGIAVAHRDRWLRLSALGRFENVTRLADLVADGRLRDLARAIERHGDDLEPVSVDLDAAGALIDSDADIWGVGLNYQGHANDLNTPRPTSGPGSYLRPTGCLIGNGEHIELPTQTQRVTAEGELGLIIGPACKNVARGDWRSVVAGITTVLDVTAEDVIRENPRYIPWAKGFDTFCSIGPVLVTLDEVDDEALRSVRVSTIRNGETVASATPAAMKYDLGFIVEYFSAGRTLRSGTVICTGTPGATVIKPGDTVTAVVEGIGALTHPVK